MAKKIGLIVWGLAGMLAATSAQAVVCTSKATGSWGTTGTWSCGHVPATTDTVVLASPFTVTLNGPYTVAAITIDAGATLADTNQNTLTVTGNITNNGTFTSSNSGYIFASGNTAVISGTGTFSNQARLATSGTTPSVAAGSNLNFTGSAQFRIGRDINGNPVPGSTLTINGTLTGTAQTGGTNSPFIRLYSTNTVVGSTGVINGGTATIEFRANNTATLTNNGNVTIGTIRRNSGTGVWTNAANSHLTVTTAFTATSMTLNASASGNTVTYTSPASPITPSNNTYYNLDGTGVVCPHTYSVLGSNKCAAQPGAGSVTASPATCSNLTGVGTIAWVNPLNAKVSDNIYATAAMASNTTTNYLNCTGFNFNAIPAGSTISGITVFVQRKASASRRAKDAFVYLIKGGTINTAFNGATTTQYTNVTPALVEAHGSMASLWGTTWTDADVKASNFGVAYAATSTKNLTVSVDQIQVRVDYSLPVEVTPSDFNIYDTSTTPASSIDGLIGTKIAGQAFTLDIAALNTAGDALLPSFAGTVKVELQDASDNSGALSNGCRSTWTTFQTLSNQIFTTGTSGDQAITGAAGRHRITPNITVNNAYKNVRVKVSYPATGTPTKVGCSTDNFAIRPSYLGGISVTDFDWQTAYPGSGTARNLNNAAATGGVVHKAGQPFTIAATAYNTAGNVTGNYTGSPVVTLNTVLPNGGVDGALTFATPAWGASAGTVSNTTAQYDEAGVFDLTLEDHDFAAVDSGDGTPASCAGYYVCSDAANPVRVGRFVPDHFELKDAAADPALDPLVNATNVDTWLPTAAHQFRTFDATDAACSTTAVAPKRSFTYVGQSFGYVAPPQATIKAMDANGGAIQNYSFTKITAAGVSQAYSAVSGTLDSTQAAQIVALTANAAYAAGTSPIVGSVTLNGADKLAFVRTQPVAQFTADISLTLDVTDSTENGVTGNGIIAAADPLVFASIPFDSGNEMRYGQLKLANVYGSELLDLPVPIVAQYFNGTGFVANAADNCTNLTAANITLGNYLGGISSANLGATHVNFVGPFAGGVGNLVLRKPAPVPAASGSTDVSVDLVAEGKAYLHGGAGYSQNPSARATFGVYKGNNTFIYRGRRGR